MVMLSEDAEFCGDVNGWIRKKSMSVVLGFFVVVSVVFWVLPPRGGKGHYTSSFCILSPFIRQLPRFILTVVKEDRSFLGTAKRPLGTSNLFRLLNATRL